MFTTNRAIVGFEFAWESDGASDTVTVNLTNGPIYWYTSNTPNLRVERPASVTNVTDISCSEGLVLTTLALHLGVLVLGISGSHVSGSRYFVDGVAHF